VACARVSWASGHADQLYGLRRRDRGLQRDRFGHPDVLAGQDHQPARDESRVLAGDQHAGQVVQCGVDVRASHRLMKALTTS